MVEKYGKQGLEVVGVTSEAADDKTMGFVEETKWQATVVVEPSGKTMNAYAFRGYPSAAMVDGTGKVVWTGHPSGLRDKMIEEHLGSVRMKTPSGLFVDVDLPQKYASVAKKLAKGNLGAGWKDLTKAADRQGLDDESKAMLQAAVEKVEAYAHDQMNLVAKACEEGRWYDALEHCELVEKHFRGAGVADKAKERRSEIKGNKEIREEIEAGKRIAKAQKAYEAGKVKSALNTLSTVTDGRLSSTAEAKRAEKLAADWRAGN